MNEHHGQMEHTGFDIEGYALFRCPICDYEIGLRHDRKKTIREGNRHAGHSASLGGAPLSIGAVEAAPADPVVLQ